MAMRVIMCIREAVMVIVVHEQFSLLEANLT
jgi:hypothetical protein